MSLPIALIITMILGTSAAAVIPRLQTSSEKTVPLATSAGKEIMLDFSTPTPIQSGPTPTHTMTPTPTITNTPTPKPTNTPTSTPTSTPTPVPITYTSQQLDEWFTRYANHYSVDRSKLWKIAVCETGLRANAVNWIYGGMFQFSPNTWIANRKLMGMDTNEALRFNAEEAIRTGAFVLSTRGPSAWPTCAK